MTTCLEIWFHPLSSPISRPLGVSMRVAAVILLLINNGLSGAQQCNEKFNIPKFSFDGYKFKCEVKMVYDDIEFDFERYLTFIFSI